MKPKKKKRFDIKNFFVMHGEKMALILILPLAIYIAYLGTLYEPLTWQPEDLRQIADQADRHVRENDWKASNEDVAIKPYDTVASWIKVGVKPDLYKTDIPWMPSLFKEKIKRAGLEAGQLLAVQELRAYTGLGAIAINTQSAAAEAAGLTKPQIGERWAVLTGLIPVKEQLEYYVNAYSSSVHPDPMRDMPLYTSYEVERAEIQPNQKPDDLKWEKIDFYTTYRKNIALWTSMALDPVDPTYVAPLSATGVPMAYPLPPVDKKFGEEVAHPPSIPLLSETQVQQGKVMEKLREKMLKDMFRVDERDFLETDPFGGASAASQGGEYESGGMPGTQPAPRRRRGRDKEEEEIIKPVEVTNYLFRFFDFNVEPGKTYRYRVRLLLANPNYRLPPNVLTDESLAKERYMTTDFSAATNMVTIPLESRVLATNVVAARSPWLDPVASILAVHFDVTDGSEWCVEKDRIYRGSTINFPKQTGENYLLSGKPKSGSVDEMGEPAPPPRRGASTRRTPIRPNPRNPVEEDESKRTIDIISDVCVLDMLGGRPLQNVGSGRDLPDLKSPGRVVVLEPSGSLVIRKVNSDLLEVDAIKNPVAIQQSMGMYEDGGGP